MSPNAQVSIWWDTSVHAYRMTSPFNRELVDAIKSFIPVSDRSYDPATKVWTFVERQFAPLQNLMNTMRLTPTVITRAQAEQAANASQNQANAQRAKALDVVVMEFVRLVPADAMLKAYRAAAMQLHPDKQGGDGSKMSSLNAAWDRLQKELYGQQ